MDRQEGGSVGDKRKRIVTDTAVTPQLTILDKYSTVSDKEFTRIKGYGYVTSDKVQWSKCTHLKGCVMKYLQ